MEPRNSHPDQIEKCSCFNKKSSGKNNALFFMYKGNGTHATSIELSFVSCFSTYLVSVTNYTMSMLSIWCICGHSAHLLGRNSECSQC